MSYRVAETQTLELGAARDEHYRTNISTVMLMLNSSAAVKTRSSRTHPAEAGGADRMLALVAKQLQANPATAGSKMHSLAVQSMSMHAMHQIHLAPSTPMSSTQEAYVPDL